MTSDATINYYIILGGHTVKSISILGIQFNKLEQHVDLKAKLLLKRVLAGLLSLHKLKLKS